MTIFLYTIIVQQRRLNEREGITKQKDFIRPREKLLMKSKKTHESVIQPSQPSNYPVALATLRPSVLQNQYLCQEFATLELIIAEREKTLMIIDKVYIFQIWHNVEAEGFPS